MSFELLSVTGPTKGEEFAAAAFLGLTSQARRWIVARRPARCTSNRGQGLPDTTFRGRNPGDRRSATARGAVAAPRMSIGDDARAVATPTSRMEMRSAGVETPPIAIRKRTAGVFARACAPRSRIGRFAERDVVSVRATWIPRRADASSRRQAARPGGRRGPPSDRLALRSRKAGGGEQRSPVCPLRGP